MRNFSIFGLIFLLSACGSFFERFEDFVDSRSFSLLGGTLFSSAEGVSVKQILLESSGMIDREVVVEGRIDTVAKESTYLILEDEESKLLVLTSSLDGSLPSLNSYIKVLGVIQNGRKGLAFLKAKSIKEI